MNGYFALGTGSAFEDPETSPISTKSPFVLQTTTAADSDKKLDYLQTTEDGSGSLEAQNRRSFGL